MTDSAPSSKPASATSSSPPEALCFDAFDTVFDTAAVASACESRWPERGRELFGRWKRTQLRYAWLRALMSRYRDYEGTTEDALRYALGALGLEASDDDVASLTASWSALDAFADAPAALERLGGDGRPLALLSNGTPAQLAGLAACSGLADRFAELISADVARTFKPHPRVYALAEEVLELERERIGFVTANAWDAAGAASFGMRVALVARADQPFESLGPEPELVVRDLTELAEAWG